MRSTRFLFYFFFLYLVSCTLTEPKMATLKQDVSIMVIVPDSTYLQPNTACIVAHEINMNSTYRFEPSGVMNDSTWLFDLSLETGFYDFTYEQQVTIDGHALSLRAYQKNCVIQAATTLPAMTASVTMEHNDFVIAEIFFAGTITTEGKQYTGDKYFVLMNNSDSLLYADGLVLMESKFLTVRRDIVTPDRMDSAMAVDALYRVPGDGQQYPVEPGGVILIADNAMDHRSLNSNSFDLSGADMEWYDVSSRASVTDVDNADVPNMDKIYCYTQTIWVPHNQGHKAFAIGRMPQSMSDEQYLRDYYYPYDYQLITQAGSFDMSSTAYLFPNEWIVDAVNTSPATTFQWLVTSSRLDAGYTYVAETGSDKTRYGKSVRRKSFRDENGRLKVQDTNNSSEDFLTAQIADPYFFVSQ